MTHFRCIEQREPYVVNHTAYGSGVCTRSCQYKASALVRAAAAAAAVALYIL